MASKQALMAAKLRELEIARKSKAQTLQASGYVRSQVESLTSETRLIENGHYTRQGNNAKLAFVREQIASEKKRKREAKQAKGTEFRHVKRRDGKTVAVTDKYTAK